MERPSQAPGLRASTRAVALATWAASCSIWAEIGTDARLVSRRAPPVGRRTNSAAGVPQGPCDRSVHRAPGSARRFMRSAPRAEQPLRPDRPAKVCVATSTFRTAGCRHRLGGVGTVRAAQTEPPSFRPEGCPRVWPPHKVRRCGRSALTWGMGSNLRCRSVPIVVFSCVRRNPNGAGHTPPGMRCLSWRRAGARPLGTTAPGRSPSC